MKIDELKKAIRGLVREEVKRAVAEEVSKAMGKVLVEMVKEIKSDKSTPRSVESQQDSDEEVLPEIIHTNNPKLNSVLAETARCSKPLQRISESAGLAELMDGGFDRVGRYEDVGIVDRPANKLDFLKQMVGETPQVSQPSALDGGAEVPAFLKKIFKKDFRTVMKKIDEQKKNGIGGLMG